MQLCENPRKGTHENKIKKKNKISDILTNLIKAKLSQNSDTACPNALL